MKNVRGWLLFGAAFAAVLLFSGKMPASVACAQETEKVPMYRLYYPDTHEHFYTKDKNELRILTHDRGWVYEGIGWYAPTDGIPVYRLYNPFTTDHHYTMDLNEYNQLGKIGWQQENIGWFSDPGEGLPMYRMFCDSLVTGTHHYTKDLNERNTLVSQGAWANEGIGWYGLNYTHSFGPQKSKDELLDFFREKTGYEPIDFQYYDFDGDGREDFFAVCSDGEGQPYQVWYVSCDASHYEPVYYDQDDRVEDFASLTAIPAGDRFHLVLNTTNEMGTIAHHTILELRDNTVLYKVVYQPGNVDLSMAGDIVLTVEDYDRMEDETGMLLGHTWKNSYLFYRDGQYGEYGATEMYGEDFYKMKGAWEAIQTIENKAIPDDPNVNWNKSGIDNMRFWKRPNGYLHVTLDVLNEDGSREHQIYTMNYSDEGIDNTPWGPEYGIFADHYSSLNNIQY